MKRAWFPLLILATLLLLSAQTLLAMELSLDQAVDISLKNNLNMQLQREQVISSSEQIETALGEFDTIFSGDAAMGSSKSSAILSGKEVEADLTTISGELAKKFSTGTRVTLEAGNRREENEANAYLIDPAYSTSLGVTVTQPLLYGRGTEVQTAYVESAKQQFQAEEYLVESQAADLAAAVKGAYWELVYSWQDIEVQKLSLTLAAKLLEETRLQIEAGRLAKIEIFQPESEVARREQQLITGERAIGVAEDNLKILLNSTDWSQAIKPLDKPGIRTVPVDLNHVMESSLANRPDLLAAKSQIRGAEIIATRKKNQTLPRLGIYGSAGIGASGDEFGNAYSNINDENDQHWQLGLTFSMPLENRYAEGEYRQALSSIRKTKIQTEILRQEIRRKVRSSVRDVELALKAIEATRKTTLATAKRLEAEQTKFESGKSTTFDVLAAQESYARTLSDEHRAKVVYVQSLAEIDRVQGIIRRGVTE
jgi:outer membrane protein